MPRVRPIGTGETARRIIWKAIAFTLKEDIQDAAGPLQVCAGHILGCKTAVHAMREVYDCQPTEAVILVDASNAFNSLNREAALSNIQQLRPSLSKIIINTYREEWQLFIEGTTLYSQKSTTQGDPLAMAMNTIALTPTHLYTERCRNQASLVRRWCYSRQVTSRSKRMVGPLSTFGPRLRIPPYCQQIWLIVNEDHLEEANKKFNGSGVSITANGKKHLGAAVGTSHFVSGYVQRKISNWFN